LQEKEVMLKEIHHRVKNNMQVITSLLYLQSRSIQDPQALAAFQDSQGRVRSMALVHEMLYQSKDLSNIEYAAYLRSLGDYMMRAHAEKTNRITLKIDCDDVYLGVNTAIPCGLLVNELLSNSFEHAFPGGRSGQVRLDFHANADDEFVLVVADNGVGLPADLGLEDVDTLGLTLVQTLVDQLDGTLEVEREGKTEFRVTFPAAGV
jgi:two-component sensor histidine kinase